ncbi:MAG: GAF domain-containing protein [Deltaproteobacteria bacterium]|nr:GAF domain-containing protein [Deltaproteobacteria bacterium]
MRRLVDLLELRRDDILCEWERRVRTLPQARGLDRPSLIDHVPDLLDRIGAMAGELAAGSSPHLPIEIAERHALERLEEGFDLVQVVTEFRMLRVSILEVWERAATAPPALAEIRLLDEAIDFSVLASVARYTAVRERTLVAFDRISTAAFESRDLTELLRRLLQVLRDSTLSVDTAAILLRDSDGFRVRAATGLDRDTEEGFAIPLKASFAGSIATSRQPQSMTTPSSRDLHSPVLASAGLRVVYGVPMIDGDEVIGVAKIGSLTSNGFSNQDKRVFAAMVARATAAIHQHVLREAAERTAADNARLYAEAQEAVRAREDVLAIVSHDLRSPLGAIELATSMLSPTCDPVPGARKYLEIVKRSKDRMEHLINDLLDLSSINAGRLALDVGVEDADQLVSEVLDVHEPRAAERGITIHRACELQGVQLACDRNRVAQVFGNLLGNAIKFCRAGDAIHVRGARDGSLARFAITDTGPGIAAESLPHVFDRYWSGKRGEAKGTGLGLYISRAIAEAHGGTIGRQHRRAGRDLRAHVAAREGVTRVSARASRPGRWSASRGWWSPTRTARVFDRDRLDRTPTSPWCPSRRSRSGSGRGRATGQTSRPALVVGRRR